tara:strand:+ start:495 stop:1352 length:858 start_codon:yes stop_codon:yes gene_type:complete
MANKIKHNKLRNTGLLYEFLIRQLTIDVLNKDSKSYAVKVIKNHFNENSELGKEFALYNILINKKFTHDKKASYFINEVVASRNKINFSQLRREKYNLIKDIKENYDINKFFSTKIKNYKIYASIYNLFEHSDTLKPDRKTEVYFNLLEFVTTKEKPRNVSMVNKMMSEDKDLAILTYKVLLEKFNDKYTSMSLNQKQLLKAYINNLSNTHSLKDFIAEEKPKLKKQLKDKMKVVDDQVVQIKLTEVVNSFDRFCKVNAKSKNVGDSVVLQMMRYYELLQELNRV